MKNVEREYVCDLTNFGIEPNPGPEMFEGVTFATFNCSGFRSSSKPKRILNKIHNLITKYPKLICALQETHLTDDVIGALDYKWKHKYAFSNGTHKECGVLTLFSSYRKVIFC